MSTQIMWTSGSAANLLTLDAALRVDETLTAQVTEHPVETGGVIADNVIMKPKALRLEGIISATPMPKPNAPYEQEAFKDELVNIEGEPGSRPDPTRPQSALETLRAIHAARMPVSVGTGSTEWNTQVTNVYDNMVVETLEIPREQQTGDALQFTATLKEIVIVSSQTVALPNSPKAGEQHNGKQATSTATPAHVQQNSPIWNQTHSKPLNE